MKWVTRLFLQITNILLPKVKISTAVILLFLSFNLEASDSNYESSYLLDSILLTGKIEAGDTQKFTVPWSQTWRQQIKWMKPEGELIKKGELAVVFDSADADSQIEQLEAQLIQTKETANNNRQTKELKVINAKHDLIRAQYKYELALTLVETPQTFISQFDRDNLHFDLDKTRKELIEAKSKLDNANKEKISDNHQQIISIEKIKSQLENKKQEKAVLQLVAERNGTILHASHPWNGSKVSVGQSVQTSWTIGSIPSSGSEYVKAWVNEVDFPKVSSSQAVIITLDAFFKKSFEGIISNISQQSVLKKEWGSSAYYEVKIDIIDKPNIKLVPGMSVRIELKPGSS